MYFNKRCLSHFAKYDRQTILTFMNERQRSLTIKKGFILTSKAQG